MSSAGVCIGLGGALEGVLVVTALRAGRGWLTADGGRTRMRVSLAATILRSGAARRPDSPCPNPALQAALAYLVPEM